MFLLHAERQQDVARAAAVAPVAGVHEDHAARNRGAGTENGRAARRHTVHGLELAVGVELPQHGPVLCRERTEGAVVRAGEHHARDDTHRRGLGGIAPAARCPASRAAAAARSRRVRRSRGERHADPGVRAAHVGHGEVHVVRVDRGAVLHPAERAALARAVLPHRASRVVGIHREADAGFLADENQIPSVRQRGQDGRVAEVEVGPHRVGAIGITGPRSTSADEHVSRRDLVDPLDRPGGHVERDHGVARRTGRFAVVVAGGDVDQRGVSRRSSASSRCRRLTVPRASRRQCSCRGASVRGEV